MPEIEILVGGRPFLVSCQPGEEHFLRAAAQMLDNEAQPLLAAMGRVPEAKMLLMAGLMLADKTAATDDELRQLRARVAELEASRGTAEVQRVEVPVIPPQVPETLAEIAAWAESLADRLDERRSA
jgi:cell division protein ZapA